MRRNTIQRQLVYTAVQNSKSHPTADEIYNTIKESYPDISLATVYRNLNLLAQDSEIRKISVPDSADRFDHTVKPHYHIKCTCCGRFEDIVTRYMDQLDSAVAEDTSYLVESHDIVFQGLCPRCSRA
mgnify:CR=1 FL=1